MCERVIVVCLSFQHMSFIHSSTLSIADLKDGGLLYALREEELRLDDDLTHLITGYSKCTFF